MDQRSAVRNPSRPDSNLNPVLSAAEWRGWRVVRGLAACVRHRAMDLRQPLRLSTRPDGSLVPSRPGDGPERRWTWHPGQGWVAERPTLDPMERDLLDLYLPLCEPVPSGCQVVAHLGQSLDGFIATACGDSCFVTGPDNIRHLHRMRALSDAVLVGTATAAADDPRLTTRLVPGDNPVRVILDRQRRLPSQLRVFTDGAAETLLLCDQAVVTAGADRQGQARVLGIPTRDDRLDLTALLETLAGLGLRRLFVEGGGATVSAFMAAGLLDRLQIAVAPLVIGTGRPGLRIPPAKSLADATRPAARVFRMGADLLFDLDLRQPASVGADANQANLLRIA